MKRESAFKKNYRTICAREISAGHSHGPHTLPLYQTNSFEAENMNEAIEVFSGKESGFIYTRYGNPTIRAVEEKLAILEGIKSSGTCYAILTSSGMSAISTICLSLLESGGEIIIHPSLYGGTLELFNTEMNRSGFKITTIDLRDTENLEAHLRQSTDRPTLLFFESPTNPVLEILDIREVCELAKKHGVTTVVDNTFCTSYLQRPLDLGADFTVYSTSKFINGHGNSMGGLIVSKKEDILRVKIWKTMKLLGTNISPFEAWLINQGLKTLPLRMDQQCANASKIATALQNFSWVQKVNYPGLKESPGHIPAERQMDQFGSMISFEVNAGLEKTIRFCDALEFSKAPTLGDPDTLLLHPATSSHINVDEDTRKATGITDSLIRLSIGIEDPDDLLKELESAGKQFF